MFDIHEHSLVSSYPISSLFVNKFFFSIQRDRIKIFFSSLPERYIINDSLSTNIVGLENPWIFDKFSEICVTHFIFEGSIENSIDDGSWGVIIFGVFLDSLSRFVG